MEYALAVAASGMAAQQRSLEVTAQNLSNLSTPGYQPLRPVFADLYGQLATGGAPTGVAGGATTALGVVSGAPQRLVSQGALQATGNPYDLALVGPGFFRLQRPDGSEVYSRDGHLHRDPSGRLVSAQGLPILGNNGPLSVPAEATGLHVDPDGHLVAGLPGGGQAAVGRLSLVDFANPAALSSSGDGLFSDTPAAGLRTLLPGTASPTRIVQGSLEDSGADMLHEMTTLLQAQRLYELNSRALQAADEMWQMANNVRR